MVHQPLIWVLTDHRAGNVAQAVGVAEALSRPFTTKAIHYNPLASLPNAVIGASALGLTPETRQQLQAPWPDVVIAAGRRTGPVARWIKRQNPHVLLVQIMNPGRRGAQDFDLIAVPRHDCELPDGDAANIMRITGAPHRLTPEKLKAAANAWAPRLESAPRPFIAIIIGGATHSRPFPTALASELGHQVHQMAAAVGGSVLLASSRRTGVEAEQALLAAIPEPRHAFLWSRGGDNPYVGYLALADAIVVTGDSVSMCSEACATPATVYIYAPKGMVAAKHARLHQELYDAGLAQPFDGTFTQGSHAALNAAGDVARAVDDLIHRRFTVPV